MTRSHQTGSIHGYFQHHDHILFCGKSSSSYNDIIVVDYRETCPLGIVGHGQPTCIQILDRAYV